MNENERESENRVAENQTKGATKCSDWFIQKARDNAEAGFGQLLIHRLVSSMGRGSLVVAICPFYPLSFNCSFSRSFPVQIGSLIGAWQPSGLGYCTPN